MNNDRVPAEWIEGINVKERKRRKNDVASSKIYLKSLCIFQNMGKGMIYQSHLL